MAMTRRGNTVKCDQKVNITAAFGSDLVLEGFTSVPNVLLKIYNRLGITDFQMMILIQMIRLKTEERELYPSTETLAACMQSEPSKIRNEIKDLIEKEIIAVSEFYDSGNGVVLKGYDFDPLFLKVSDIWAGMRFKEIEESEKHIRKDSTGYDFMRNMYDIKTAELITVFEKEFGRALSPMEAEQISKWADEMDARLVIEALKRAVLGGKHNFKYINGILQEWKKNNLRTLDSIAEYDANFRRRRSEKGLKGRESISKNDTKKKAFMRSLYI